MLKIEIYLKTDMSIRHGMPRILISIQKSIVCRASRGMVHLVMCSLHKPADLSPITHVKS